MNRTGIIMFLTFALIYGGWQYADNRDSTKLSIQPVKTKTGYIVKHKVGAWPFSIWTMFPVREFKTMDELRRFVHANQRALLEYVNR